MVTKTYEIINVRDLWLANHMTSAGEPMISVQQMCRDGEQFVVPDLSYGDDAEGSAAELDPIGTDACVPGPLVVPVPEIYFVKDCIIWSKYGIVTVGNYLLKETLFSVPLDLVPELRLIGKQYYEEKAELEFLSLPSANIGNAISILSGVHQNYYHYLMFFLTKLDPSVFYAPQWDCETGTPSVIAPDGLAEYQADCLGRLCDLFSAPCITLEEKACVRVQNLALPHMFRYGGLVPHPLIKRPLGMLRKCFPSIATNSKNTRLYISRQDFNDRELENEQEIEELVSSYGFTLVCLSDLPISSQIELFSNATHIIAPHGAGITNIVFCKPATNLLEIHMLSYNNWCYRRIAGIYNLNYGCIWATPTSPGNGHVNTRYYLQPSSLRRVLTDPEFLSDW
jgi:hypothetical protein